MLRNAAHPAPASTQHRRISCDLIKRGSAQCKQKIAGGILDGCDDEAKKRKVDGLAAGRACANEQRAVDAHGIMATCAQCKEQKYRFDADNNKVFSDRQWERNRLHDMAICEACVLLERTIVCTVCGNRNPVKHYKRYHRKHRHIAVCDACTKKT